jgi:hypothetical protein
MDSLRLVGHWTTGLSGLRVEGKDVSRLCRLRYSGRETLKRSLHIGRVVPQRKRIFLPFFTDAIAAIIRPEATRSARNMDRVISLGVNDVEAVHAEEH